MQRRHGLAQVRMCALVVAVLVLAGLGCRELNREYYCPAHPEDPDCPPSGEPCGGLICEAPTAVCKDDLMCVECLNNAQCAAEGPICSAQNTCVGCDSHDDCAESKLCLLEGQCARVQDVTYVAEVGGSDNPGCTIDMPCSKLEHALRPAALRRYIKVTGAMTDNNEVLIDGKTVDIYGDPDAKISRSTAGKVLEIKGPMNANPKVGLIDLEIIGNLSTSESCVQISEAATVTMTRVKVSRHEAAGIYLAGTAKLVLVESEVHENLDEGVKVTGGTLELHRSFIYKNAGVAGVYSMNAAMVTIESSTIASNDGTQGGVSIAGPFSIRNSIIARNGNINITTIFAGGLNLTGTAAKAEFEFNTVSDNISQSGIGLACNSVLANVTNSIITGNALTNCNVSYSLRDIAGTPGQDIKVGNPMFVTRTLLDKMFYRIGITSAALDSADPAATLDVDIDGQVREGRRDMGADEYRP